GAFLRVGPDYSNAREVLLYAAADVGEHGLDLFETVVNAAAENHDDERDQRRRYESDHGKPPIGPQHDRNGEHGSERRLGPVHDSGAEHHTDRVKVVRGARHDVAGPIFCVETRGERYEMREEAIAEVVLDVAGDADDN